MNGVGRGTAHGPHQLMKGNHHGGIAWLLTDPRGAGGHGMMLSKVCFVMVCLTCPVVVFCFTYIHVYVWNLAHKAPIRGIYAANCYPQVFNKSW